MNWTRTKSLAELFDRLRVADNERYPAFFTHRGHTYVLKISKKTMKNRTIHIGGRVIGGGNRTVLVVAELSGNHNGDIKRALKIIDAAADAGADAVKFQTYTPDTITIDSDEGPFQVNWKGKRRTLHDLYSEAYTPWEWHARLFAHAKKRGLLAFSAPFDPTAVTFLEKLRVPCHKVASFEVVDTPLLEAIGKTKKPVIMSRGWRL